MKPPAVLLLVASLAANAWLLAWYFHRTAATGPYAASATARGTDAASPTAAGLRALEPAALRAQLQRMDLPGEVVDTLVAARIFSRHDARRRELMAGTMKLPWWQTVTAGLGRMNLLSPAQRKELRELEANARDEVLRLLGPQALDRDGLTAFRHGFLAPEKAVLLDAILRDYQNLSAELKEETHGLRTAADREREKFLETERQRDLAALLTPVERELFELRASPTANRIQRWMSAFSATEAEYRAVFAIYKAFDEKFPGNLTPVGTMRNRDFSAFPEFQQQLRDALGDMRYADWKLRGPRD